MREHLLLQRMKEFKPELDLILREMNAHWTHEDPVYRFYHQSFKVYDVQQTTLRAVGLLQKLVPECPLNSTFSKIITEGTGRVFEASHNQDWERYRPSERRFWRQWTKEEIEESERRTAEGGMFALWQKKPGEGCYLAEAYLPEHRRQRFMGELPHQWVEIYGRCNCDEFMEYWIKFCDGIATEVRSTEPTLGPEFFENAQDWC